jgi:XTP/dITP diphosphohydrolase
VTREVVIASRNRGKIAEILQIFADVPFRMRSLADFPDAPEIEETGSTFAENARLKAVGIARHSNLWALADDSGLEVDALDGAPGVHSARYAGIGNTREERDRANREKLVAELRKRGATNRSARLVCTLCLADATGRVLFESRGTMDGLIVDDSRGGNGFGYDSHLFLPDVNKTAAELTPDELNARSHRGAAARALHAWLTTHAPSQGPRAVTALAAVGNRRRH